MRKEEIYLAIPGHENYECSNWGHIRNQFGKLLKPYPNSNKEKTKGGYCLVKLSNGDGTYTQKYVHILVCSLFCPARKNRKQTQVNHLNTIKTDNYYKNLEWSTPKENIRFKRVCQFFQWPVYSYPENENENNTTIN